MNYFSIIYKLIIIPLILVSLVGCEEDKNEEAKAKIKFLHYPGDHSERLFRLNSNDGFYITLPSCFKVARYSQISITNEENYECNETQSYFSIDRFTPSDVSYYEKYFSSDSTIKVSNKELLLQYVLDSRSSNLDIQSSSIFTEMKTNSGVPMTLAAVKGSETNYSNPLYYQYGIFSLNKDIYVVQLIVNEGDISFFHEDIMKIFKSIRKF